MQAQYGKGTRWYPGSPFTQTDIDNILSSVTQTTVYLNPGSGTDISRLITQAQVDLGAAGGIIEIPAGTFIVEGVVLQSKIKIRGAGKFSTILVLSPSPTRDMFTQAATLSTYEDSPAIFEGFTALATLTPAIPLDKTSALNFSFYNGSRLDRIYNARLSDVRAYYFNYVYLGASLNGDLSSNFVLRINDGCDFQYNKVAVYANEEIELSDSSFDNNVIAYKGRPNDGKINFCNFEANDYGIVPGDSAEDNIHNFTITSCIFFKQKFYDAKLGYNCTVDDCECVGDDAQPTSSGFLIVGNNNQVTARLNEGAAHYQVGFVVVVGTVAATTVNGLKVDNCQYLSDDTANVGPMVQVKMTNAGSNLIGLSISGTLWSGAPNKVLGFLTNTQIDGYKFNNNEITLSSGDMTSGTPIASFEMFSSVIGGMAQGNTFFASGGLANNKMNCFKGAFGKINLSGNNFNAASLATCNAFTGFVPGTTVSDASYIQNNANLFTRATGTIAPGGAVNFGNANTNITVYPSVVPKSALISVLALNASGAATPIRAGASGPSGGFLFAQILTGSGNFAGTEQYQYVVEVFAGGAAN